MKKTYIVLSLILVSLVVTVFILNEYILQNSTNNTSSNDNNLSYPVDLGDVQNSYISKDVYSFNYSNNWYIHKEIENTVIFKPTKYKEDDKVGSVLVITLSDSFGMNAKEWLSESAGNYVNSLESTINGNEAFSADYERDEYYDRRYVVRKDEKIVLVQFRIWTKDLGVIKDYSEFEEEVEEIVKTIKFIN